jgi:hypothetical protein
VDGQLAHQKGENLAMGLLRRPNHAHLLVGVPNIMIDSDRQSSDVRVTEGAGDDGRSSQRRTARKIYHTRCAAARESDPLNWVWKLPCWG